MRSECAVWRALGYGSRDELETAGADQLVESPADLARTVSRWSMGSHPQARAATFKQAA